MFDRCKTAVVCIARAALNSDSHEAIAHVFLVRCFGRRAPAIARDHVLADNKGRQRAQKQRAH